MCSLLFPNRKKTKTACVNLIFHIGINKLRYSLQMMCYFFVGCSEMKTSQLFGGRECWRSGWGRKRQRCFRGSSTSKLPAVNQRSRLSPGATLSSNPGGGPPQGKKNTTKQMQGAAGQRVCVCVCVYACVLYFCPRVDSYNCACVRLHMYLCTVHEFIWGWELHLCLCVCVLVFLHVWRRFVRQPAPEGGEFCLHIDEPATLPLCPWALRKHHNQFRASPFQSPP